MQILPTYTRAVGVALFIILFLYTLFLLRSNRLSAQHAMSWIIAELTMLTLIIFDPISTVIMRLTGAINVLSTIFLLATIWGVLLMLDLLVRISELTVKLRAINQELGLLNERFDRLQENLTRQTLDTTDKVQPSD
jgi:hypothetical protein